jgi:magnesium chelatase subunit D
MTVQPGYPFTAVVGQPTMKLALVLNAINPRLGGVLIRGEKGTAKSTAARGLAALLPSVHVVHGCRFACDPQRTAELCPECVVRTVAGESLTEEARPAAFVELPIGATEDRVLGSLDLERALGHGERRFEPGLLARANRGLLYVDEVNLLPDHLVDALLDAAAMGTNTVEREGLSFSHSATFVLVGTMNPEEGELRPQLLDRFGLAVDVAGMPDPAERAEVVRRRIAYEADPAAFVQRWASQEAAERTRIERARALLPGVTVDDAMLDLIARIGTEFAVDGLRADLVMYKAAASLAAYVGRTQATVEDVRRAAELALPHRRRRQPFDAPGLDQERLDSLVDDHDDPPQGPSDSASTSMPEHVFEVDPVEAPPVPPPPRASLVDSPHGRHVRSVSIDASESRSLDVSATLLASAPHQLQRRQAHEAFKLERRDVRVKLRQDRPRRCTLFVVDASGSMAARRRMAAAKGAVVALLKQAYQQRDDVGLIAFRGSSARLLLLPTNSVELASMRLRELPTGGRTPLAAALRLALTTLGRWSKARRAATSSLVVLVSDGRANVAVESQEPFSDALEAARTLSASGAAALVVDSEDGPIRLGLARRVCAALNGHYMRLSDLLAASRTPGSLAAAVRQMHAS